MTAKNFDCVRMKQQGTERVMKRLEGMTIQEQIEYWRQGTADLEMHKQELKKRKQRS